MILAYDFILIFGKKLKVLLQQVVLNYLETNYGIVTE